MFYVALMGSLINSWLISSLGLFVKLEIAC